ncbi:hypothetical protein K2X14_14135 [Acetobacter sp. TBRC 12305]|uniref:Uncharacterized protein n=1 Tax=Acetobacter garciniae TaxID=2817435 RepID=A0A939KNE3_9PROT|nr:hypothetical protein [Acetobacter garciniae]MBO1326288.1 hypothetical protein [Acetobacter garciniae]MBX0345973.1 hypothetical protein [Acetobacter garciniae]
MKSWLLCVLMAGATSAVFVALPANAATQGCEALVQAAATGAAAQMKSDDQIIKQPESVTKFTCLDGFFNGVGIDLLTNGLDVASIAKNLMGKVCSEVNVVWNSLEGAAQCGLTVTGPDNNFNLGLGLGNVCPNLNFGGGGDTLINSGMNTSGQGSWDINGQMQLPDGYSLGNAASAFGLSGGSL